MATSFQERLERIAAAPNSTAAPMPGDISNATPAGRTRRKAATGGRMTRRRLPIMPVVMTVALLAGLVIVGKPDMLNVSFAGMAFATPMGTD
jgi:hypothetical protein